MNLKFWKTKNSTLAEPSDELLAAFLDGNQSYSGVNVTEDKAIRVAAVFSCIRVLSSTMAALPLHLQISEGEDTKKAKDHPLYELLHILPNEEMVAFNHRQMIMSAICLRGTSYNEYARDGRGQVREIVPLMGDMQVSRNAQTERLIYEHFDGHKNKVITADKMWRITGYTDNGITGKTPLGIARDTIGNAIASSQFGGNLFKNGTKLSGILSVVQKLNKEQRKEVIDGWNESYQGISNTGKTGLLHNGATFTPMSMTANDAQFIETMKFQRSEIAGIFGVPPHMIGDLDKATFSNIEHQGISYVIHSCMPHLVNFEQSVYRDLLTPSERKIYQAKFNVDGLLRGDSKSRADFYKALFNMGALEIDDIRKLENMNPVEGGDNRYMQINMGKIDESGNITGATNETTQQTTELNQD